MLHIPTLQSAKQQAGQKRSVSAKEFRVSSHKLFPAADEKPDTADAQAAETDRRPRKNTEDTTYIYKYTPAKVERCPAHNGVSPGQTA